MKKIVMLLCFMSAIQFASAGVIVFRLSDVDINAFLSNPTFYINGHDTGDFGVDALVVLSDSASLTCFDSIQLYLDDEYFPEVCGAALTSLAVSANYTYKKETALSVVYVDTLDIVYGFGNGKSLRFSCDVSKDASSHTAKFVKNN